MPLGTFCMGAIAASQGVGVHLYAASAAAEAAAIGAMGGVVAAVAAALPRVAGGYAPTLVGVILQREVAFGAGREKEVREYDATRAATRSLSCDRKSSQQNRTDHLGARNEGGAVFALSRIYGGVPWV